MNKKAITIFAAASLMAGCASPTTARQEVSDVLAEEEARKQRSLAMRSYLDSVGRLYRLAYPLKAASLFLCPEEKKGYDAGFRVSDINAFPEDWHEVAAAEFGFAKTTKVTEIIPGSPADKAGLQTDDVIVSFDGDNLPLREGKKNSERIAEMWKKSVEDGELTVEVSRDGEVMELEMELIETCNYPAEYLKDSGEINAYADGDAIYVTKGMMRFANDIELSTVLAHEISHNVMEHIEAKQTNAVGGLILDVLVIGTTGVDPGIRNVAAQAYSQEFEAEADYVSVYIMSRADLEIDDIANFWRRMGAEHDGSIEKNISSTHPSSPERFVGLENSIKEVQEKIANNEELVPNLKEDEKEE